MIDPAEFGKQMGAIVREATSPLLERIKQLEARQLERGEKGDRGSDGKDATAPTDEQISAAVTEYLKANPPAKGEKGDRGDKGIDGNHGRDGTDGDAGKDGIDGKSGERGDKGIDGNNGLNAEVSYDDIVKAVEEVHERVVAKYELTLERRGMDAITRALDKIVQPKDGKDGRDGKDGLSVESMTREYDPVAHEIVERWTAAGQAKELRVPMGGIHARGYWREGIQAKAGEGWTHEGTWWIALKDNSSKPANPSTDWVIGAKAGRNGNDGRNGRDATVKLNGA